jgi:uncharacterized protein DUF4352
VAGGGNKTSSQKDTESRSTTTSDSGVIQTGVPGTATLETSGQTVKLDVTDVSFKNESIPGNEFTKAGDGKVFMAFAATINNVGAKDVDLNSSEYRRQLPSGEIAAYIGFIEDGDDGISTGTTLPPGAKKAAQLTWKVPTPSGGQKFVLLWKPSPFDKDQAKYTYEFNG